MDATTDPTPTAAAAKAIHPITAERTRVALEGGERRSGPGSAAVRLLGAPLHLPGAVAVERAPGA